MPVSLVKDQSQRKTLTDQRRGNGNLLLKYCHGAALQKHNQEMEIYRACSKYDTSQIKPMHTAKFSLNPISLLIPHALHFVCSLSDLFPSIISKEQTGVLHIHPALPSNKTNCKYLWSPVHLPSLMLQYPPFTSAYSLLHAHVLPSLPTHFYFPKQTLFRQAPNPKNLLLTSPACQCHWSPFCLSSVKLHEVPFYFLFLTSFLHPKSLLKIQSQFRLVFSHLFVTTDISDSIRLLKTSSSFSFLTYALLILLLLPKLTLIFSLSLSPLTYRIGVTPVMGH